MTHEQNERRKSLMADLIKNRMVAPPYRSPHLKTFINSLRKARLIYGYDRSSEAVHLLFGYHEFGNVKDETIQVCFIEYDRTLSSSATVENCNVRELGYVLGAVKQAKGYYEFYAYDEPATEPLTFKNLFGIKRISGPKV